MLSACWLACTVPEVAIQEARGETSAVVCVILQYHLAGQHVPAGA